MGPPLRDVKPRDTWVMSRSQLSKGPAVILIRGSAHDTLGKTHYLAQAQCVTHAVILSLTNVFSVFFFSSSFNYFFKVGSHCVSLAYLKLTI